MYPPLMLNNLAKKLFGSANDRFIATLQRDVTAINALEPRIASLSDADLRAKTDEFRVKIATGASLDSLLVEAFAVVREAAKRVLGMRHFDVQLIGGMVLHRGMIAEMKTGEGKTLVATLASYLNALSGKGVHIVTVNDYLAKRDSAWMGRVHQFLGLTVGVIVNGLDDEERRAAYNCDITYGTNNEYGFDYLRDNMKYSRDAMVQRPFNFAVVDEVDSILIDEARTPLIISGPTEDNSELYTKINRFIPKLAPEHYELDEKARSVTLTEAGVLHMEELLVAAGLLKQGTGLYDIENVGTVHHVNQALRAHKLFTLDSDYIVKDDRVVIIDEFTGRMMDGRRYSEGLHQALEAKENVSIQNENQTLASITFQNYFRLFPKLSGMTGTAMTEAGEFSDIYKLEVIEIPTHRAVSRTDADDEIYRTGAERDKAVVQLIAEAHRRQQPVLVGTVSIEKSELLSARLKDKKFIATMGNDLVDRANSLFQLVEKNQTRDRLYPQKKSTANLVVETGGIADGHAPIVATKVLENQLKKVYDKHQEQQIKQAEELKKTGEYLLVLSKQPVPIPHQVLNARYHEQEAQIIAQAGQPGAVTIATNMAGRGTDIMLGGNAEMLVEKEGIRDSGLGIGKAENSHPQSPIPNPQSLDRIRAEVAKNREIVVAAGGLYVIATERHESRRIDNQLRGRAGRQGDPGASKFFLSLQDDLMRIFGSERIDAMLGRMGLKEDEAIFHPWMNKAIQRAQTKVEQRNYEIRKNLLRFDDVMNDQRKVIYEQRLELMDFTDVNETIESMRLDVNQQLVSLYIPANSYAEAWDPVTLQHEIFRVYGLGVDVEEWAKEEGIADEEILLRLNELTEQLFAAKAASFPPHVYNIAEKRVLLETLDQLWKDHLLTLDHLRQGINLRAYAQRDPLNEYKQEAFSLFEAMLNHLREVVVSRLARIQIRVELTDELMNMKLPASMHENRADLGEAPSNVIPMKNAPGKVSRNEPCPCGSGKKFKHCHGALK